MRLLIGLNTNAQLDHVSLQEAIGVHALIGAYTMMGERVATGYEMILRQHGEALAHGLATGSLRQKLEDFIATEPISHFTSCDHTSMI